MQTTDRGHYLRELGALFFLVSIGLFALFSQIIGNPYYYFAADTAELYLPWWIFFNSAIRALTFPLRNPFWFLGSMPYAALETNAFYPPYILVQFLFNAKDNLDAAFLYLLGMELAHYYLAAVGMYILLRRGLRLNALASIFASLVYSCSGIFIGRFVHIYFITQFAWLPLLFFGLFLFLEKRQLIYVIFTGIILAMIIVAGHPQFTLYIFLFFIFALVYFTLVNSRHRWYAVFIGLLTAIGLGVFLAAPKLLLTYEFSQNVVRSAPELMISELYNSLHPLYYLTFFIPHLFGRHVVGYWGSDYPWGNWDHYFYLGLLPLFFFPFALRCRNRKVLGFFLATAALLIILSFGKYFWLSKILNLALPFANKLALVSRLTNLLHFSLVVLVGIGVHELFTSKRRREDLLVAVLTVVIFGIILFGWGDVLPQLQPAQRLPPSILAISYALESLYAARIFLIGTAIVFLLFIHLRKHILVIFMIVIYLADIFYSSNSFNPIEAARGFPSKYFGVTQDLVLLKSDPTIFRVHQLEPRNINMVQNIQSTFGYHTAETMAYHRVAPFIRSNQQRILDLLNIKYIFSDEDLSRAGNFTKVGNSLWRNETALPRVFFVNRFTFVKNEIEMLAKLTDPGFDPANQAVFFAGTTIPRNQSSDQSNKGSNAQVQIVSYSLDQIEVLSHSDSDGFLILSELTYPGWSATIDGEKKSLVNANYVLHALPIVKGSHRVRFTFSSQPMQFGLAISCITIVILIFLILHKKTRKYLWKKMG